MRWSVPSFAVALLATPLAACFYMDPINERPSADIKQVNPELPFRGDPIRVEPRIIDPDGDDDPIIAWRAYACNDDAYCDPEPYVTGSSFFFDLDAAEELVDRTPTTLIRIELDVTDRWGAEALPRQQLDLPIADHNPVFLAPVIDGHSFEGSFTVGTTATVNVHADDADDPDALTFIDPPPIYPPDGVPGTAATLLRVDGGDDNDADGEASWNLMATEPGQWIVHVEVVDPLDDPTLPEEDRHHAILDVPVVFTADLEPCLGQTDPSFPPDGAFVVVDERRRFSVDTVLDDLDRYPADPDPYYGLATFRWFLDGAELDVDGNAVEIDPALYLPGTQLDLRVEAVDRMDQPLCDSSLDSCEDRPACFQRRTWAVEIR